MTTQVYYRKWRPQRLADLVGQEPIVRTLGQAIARQRVAHAYLFCGPRGTGKTSTARILAKAVNCLAPQDGEPCNDCQLCIAVNEGRALDLVEIDAASNRGIDEIRSIRERVNYAPSEGTYKVYVLDEAHMLTDAASDALLKTLEEPPAHVIFILATTEPHRLSGTIVSRCQRFDFRRITPTAMVERLAQICATEGIDAEPAALHALARNAAGSLRDAENLLEQAVTSFGSPLGLEQVHLLLGLTADDRVRALIGHVLHGQTPQALTMLNAIATEGLDLHQLHRQIVDELRELLLIKSGAQEMVAQPDEVVQEQSAAVASVPAEQLLRTLRLLGQVNFRFDTPGALSMELAIIEAAQEEVARDIVETKKVSPMADRPTPAPSPSTHRAAASAPPVIESVASEARLSVPPQPSPPARRSPVPTPETREQAPADEAPVVGVSSGLEQEWVGLIKTLSRHKGRRFNLGALLRACRNHRLEGDTLALEFTHQSHMERMKDEMDNPESRRTFMEAVTTALGITTPLNLSFTAPNGQEGANNTMRSPLLRAALGMGAKIIEETEEHHE
ncbi:MAG: DNA polymerase III subunit gamma/tau [Dehalococcoidia bacterium]